MIKVGRRPRGLDLHMSRVWDGDQRIRYSEGCRLGYGG